MLDLSSIYIFFFFNDTATTEIYTLSLHDALPISDHRLASVRASRSQPSRRAPPAHPSRTVTDDASVIRGTSPSSRNAAPDPGDRKSTRLNSSHANISYAVFCLKKKK